VNNPDKKGTGLLLTPLTFLEYSLQKKSMHILEGAEKDILC